MGAQALEQVVLGNTLDQWFRALAIAGCAWLLGQVLYRLSRGPLRRMAARTETPVDDLVIGTIQGPVVVFITVMGMLLGYNQLTIGERVDGWVLKIIHVVIALTVTWMLARVLSAIITGLLTQKGEEGQGPQQSHVLPAVAGTTKILIWGLGIVVALNNAGYDVGALLAGIGIGGLAMAMAAKDTVANVFGGITVYADKPFRTGDRIMVDGFDGTVTSIGIRSTRIRTLDGSIVVIPNHLFTEKVVTNITVGASRRIRHEIGLVYQTSPKQLERAMEVLRGIVMAHQDHLTSEHVVSFTTFGAYSLNILFVYHIRQGHDLAAAQNAVHLDILERFTAEGLEFAYPTQVEMQMVPNGSGSPS